MRRLFQLLCILCLFLPLSLWGASGRPAGKQYFYRKIPMQSGLSSAVTSVLVCAEKGYVWVGTRSGIGRYDGYLSKSYLRENISQLLEDRNHMPWAVCGKVFRYDEHADDFVEVKDDEGHPISAISLCAWDDGIYLGGLGMLYKYTYADDKVRLVHRLETDRRLWMSEMCRWDDRTLLITQERDKVMLLDVHTGEVRPAPFDGYRAMTSLIDSCGRIWVAHYNRNIACYDRSGRLLQSYSTRDSELKSDVVLTLAEHEGLIWAGTDGAGITVIDPEQQTSFTLKKVSGDPYSLPAKSILCLYKDNSDGLWAGSVRDGLFNIKEVNMKTHTDALPGQTYGLSEKAVLSLYQDEDDRLWVGTDGGGINCYDARTGKFEHILSSSEMKVAGITGFDDEHLLVFLFSKGLFTFHKRTHALRPLTLVNDSIDAALCRSGVAVNVFQDTPGSVILLSRVPYCYHIGEKRFTPIPLGEGVKRIYGDLFSIGKNGFYSYFYDQKHVYRMDSRHRTMEAVYQIAEESDTVFRSVSLDSKGRFWIGSNFGLGCYHPAEGRYESIPHSLITRVNSLVCDGQGRVWLGTEGKLFAYLIAERKFILFDESDGVLPNEYLVKARLVVRNGDICLGGVNGLLYIDRSVCEAPFLPPFLQVADVYAGGVRRNDEVTADDRLEISEHSKPIVLRVSERHNDVFRKSMYRFTVEGLSDEPIYSYQPEVTLNSLPSGTYQVKAACSIRNGGWTDDYLVLTLHVRPLWYNSFGFRAALVLLVLAIAMLVYRRMEQRKNLRLQQAMYEHEQQANEEKVRFLINISHELRTPLTLIHSPLKQLVKDIGPDHAGHSLLQGICRQTDRMKNILNTVLQVRKMEVGGSTLHAAPVRLDEWIGRLLEDFRPEASSRGIRILYQSDASVQTLCLDEEKCTTVLTNLLVNALKYTSEGSTVMVSTCQAKGGVRIAVSDEGPGLKDVDPSHLFTRFYQGSNSRPGTGIGLSYCKILVEQHGGKIGASENEEAGSTFWFELPADIKPGDVVLQPQPYLNDLLSSTADAEATSDGQAASVETFAYTVLLVDDNKDLTDYLHSSLKDCFKEAWVAADGVEALQICREKRPDIVVSDIQMPRMNGYELCRHIKEDLDISHTPVVLLTARYDAESQLFGYKNGADAYITKPFEIDTLHSLIYTSLENRKRVRMRYAGTGPLPAPEESTFSLVDESFLLKLNGLINDHLSDEQLDVPFLCREVGMSRSSLYNKMKGLVGMSTNDYITKLRMDRAKHLVLYTKYTVGELADEVGFASGKYFSSVFKQHTGLTPTQFREQHRKKSE